MSENGMTGFGELFANLPDIWLAKQEIREGDWFEGDILYCGKCRQPRRGIQNFMGKDRLVTLSCDCEKEAAERERLAEIVKKNREVCGMDALAMSHTFDTFQITENVRIEQALIGRGYMLIPGKTCHKMHVCHLLSPYLIGYRFLTVPDGNDFLCDPLPDGDSCGLLIGTHDVTDVI